MHPTAISPFSGKVSDTIWGKIYETTIFQCKETGALFFDRTAFVENDYKEYYPYLIDFDQNRINREVEIRRKKIRFQLNKIDRFVSGKNVLDIGAGPGYFCKIAADLGWNATAVEISIAAQRCGEKYLGVTYVPLVNIKENSMDAVICHHVLEHIPNPVEFLNSLSKILKKGGILAIHVPHQQPLDLLIKSLFKKQKLSCLYGNEHISGFTESSLSNFLFFLNFIPVIKTTVSGFSNYYDPFFLKNFLSAHNYLGILKKCFVHAVNTVGKLFGKGAWVILYVKNNKP
jgi:SAM-dependent methyltransferase